MGDFLMGGILTSNDDKRNFVYRQLHKNSY